MVAATARLATPITIQLRCTVSFLLMTLATVTWKAAVRLLPSSHPARTFASSAPARAEIAMEAAKFTPCGNRRIERASVSVWLIVALILLSELTVTDLFWDGVLPGF